MALALALAFSMAVPISGAGETAPTGYTLEEITGIFYDELDGDKMLWTAAYNYQGWRTSSGNWLNAIMDYIHNGLVDVGFKDGERTTANNQGDSVWFQVDTEPNNWNSSNIVNVWNLQYMSLKVVDDPSFDQASAELTAKVNIMSDCIDPTSIYWPSDLDSADPTWMIAALSDPGSADYKRMQNMQKRVHVPTNMAFTKLTDEGKSAAQNINDGTIKAEVVNVGTVTATANSMGIPDSDLRGKILLTTSAGATARTYATSVGAVAVLARVSDAPTYRMPVIDGVRLYTDSVVYTGMGNYAEPGAGALGFHFSLDQYNALASILTAEDTVEMEICVLGTYEPGKPRRIVVAEIQGSVKPEERIYIPAHLQDPGAGDNASGPAMGYNIAATMKRLIDEGVIARPERTITFVFGDENRMTENWLTKYMNEFRNVKGSVDLDMTGEDPAKTGGSMLIEKTPDPSNVATTAVAAELQYRYGQFTFPGQTNLPTFTTFIRKPDKFSLWTSVGNFVRQPVNNYPGFFLNDLYKQTGLIVQKESPDFKVDSNPYEGGSDHTPFVLGALSRIGTFVPALLSWHFTDYFYHSSADTLDKLSAREFHDVSTVTSAVAYQMANCSEGTAPDMIDQVIAGWEERLGYETQNTDDHYDWLVERGISGVDFDNAYNTEMKAIGDWSRWYVEAVKSVSRCFVGGKLGTPYSLGPTLQAKEDEAIARIEAETVKALDNVDKVFGKDTAKRPIQIATANLPQPVYIPAGTSADQMAALLPDKITVQYVGGGTGQVDVAWSTATNPAFSASRAGLYRVNGTLSGLEDGVVNWAVVQAVAEVNAVNPVVSLGVASVSGIEGDVEYTLSVSDAVDLLAVELELEVDGNMLAFKGIDTLAGFTDVNGIAWKSMGGDVWKGTVTLGYPAGSDTGFSVFIPADIAKFVFAPMAEGFATVKLTDITAVCLACGETRYIDAVIANGEATTEIAQLVFSKYDLNKDNKVDALDLGIMLLYCGFDKDSPSWGTLVKVNDSKGRPVTASMCDVNGDGVVDMLDLLDLFIHYTK